jgi:pimeloyl-ACP methyl ester carboxylesterase
VSEPVIRVRPVAGLQTGVCVVGEGRPVLALHGWGGSIRRFWPVAERLGGMGYQLHVLDFPGFGQSVVPPTVWGVADFAHFVLAYLDDAHLAQTSILGHSFGGRVSLVWPRAAGRVRRMVLANSAGLKTPPALHRWHTTRLRA